MSITARIKRFFLIRRAKREGDKVRRGEVTLVDMARRTHRSVPIDPTPENRALLKHYGDLQQILVALQQRIAGLAVNYRKDELLQRRLELEKEQVKCLAAMREDEVLLGLG